jgi:uncharacterized membrane protein YdjX (TVP38/TMEM64 family)
MDPVSSAPPPVNDALADELADIEEVAEAVSPHGWRRWLRLVPVAVIVAAVALVFASGLNRYLSLDELQAKRMELLAAVRAHPIEGLLIYMGAYVLVVAFSIPGAMIMTMTGGFLFGPVLGSAAAVTGATTGATVMFLVARSALGEVLRRRAKAGGVMERIQEGVRANAFTYLLVLRLLPAVPFWLCNIASGFVAIPLRTYILATVLGIIPSTAIYASIGAGLGHVFARGEKPDIGLVLDPQVMLPLIGLAVLSVLPVGFHAWKVRRRRLALAK